MQNEKEIIITLGQPPSLNTFYSGRHWTVRKKLGDEYKRQVKDALGAFDIPTIETFTISIRYNSRFDCDNSILCSKFVSDALVEAGFVDDDNPKHYKSLRISFDETLPKKTYQVKIRYYER
mgnify:FL=1